MPLHARRQLLDEVKQSLLNLPTSGTNVYEDPASAVQDDLLPALVIEPVTEEIESLGEVMLEEDGYHQRRVLSVLVTAVCKSAAERESLSVEIEEAVMRTTIGRGSRLVNEEFSASSEGGQRLWMIGLTFDFSYLTSSKYPRTAIR